MFENKNREINFEEYPVQKIDNLSSMNGYDEIVEEIKKQIKKVNKDKCLITFEYYHGVNEEIIFDKIIKKLGAEVLINSNDAKYEEDIILKKFHKNITDDRINGVYAFEKIDEYFSPEKIDELNEKIMKSSGLIILYGVASSVICRGDINVYANISTQTIKNKYAQGMDNWGAKNYDEDILRKEKRYYFLESKLQDRHKRNSLKTADYIIDCNREDDFVMLNKENYHTLMNHYTKSPFKPVPIFLSGIWGGNWSQEVLGVGKELRNTAWGITGYLDWQSLATDINGKVFEMPATDIIQYDPKGTIGAKLWHLYGYRCPLHVNFLDTWGGDNLSLQVHPTMSYSQEVFNSPWGHYESYYILDSKENSSVYLGTKTGTKLNDLVNAFEDAQHTGKFDDNKYINHLPVKKHDHVFIPAGAIHSSGKDTLVMEIDMFTFTTFKLWDWGRIDFDGKPRPINIDHGKHVIQEEFQTEFVKDYLVSKQTQVADGYGWQMERSGTMSYEAPMEVNRYWFTKSIHFDPKKSMVIHVLVEGEEAIIESIDNSFKSIVMHYAEAVFIPAEAGQYIIKPYGISKDKELAVLEIFMNI